MEKVKIISYASDICWWMGCVDQICEVVDIHDLTGYKKIRVILIEKGFEDEPFEIDGWVNPIHIIEVREED